MYEKLREYEKLNRMSQVDTESGNHSYYLLHHALIRECSATTKVRVVFDGIVKSNAGISLNDKMIIFL